MNKLLGMNKPFYFDGNTFSKIDNIKINDDDTVSIDVNGKTIKTDPANVAIINQDLTSFKDSKFKIVSGDLKHFYDALTLNPNKLIRCIDMHVFLLKQKNGLEFIYENNYEPNIADAGDAGKWFGTFNSSGKLLGIRDYKLAYFNDEHGEYWVVIYKNSDELEELKHRGFNRVILDYNCIVHVMIRGEEYFSLEDIREALRD